MKKYVILCKGIEDLTGAPRYVNNKCRYLKEHGWEVMVFWSYDVSHAQLEHLIPFDNKDFIFHELLFFPCWFTKRQQKSVVNRIANRIGTADQIVIESNKLQLGAWGEMLAKELKSKHICFVTTEKIKIHNKSTFDFCYAKLRRNEFFTIHAPAVKHLFSNFIEIEHPENYYWSALPGVEVEQYSFPDFDEMPHADFTITSFGRAKGYFPYMLEQLSQFFLQHSDKTFNVFFLGDIKDTEKIKLCLSQKNVHVVLHSKAVKVIPLQVFTKSDVVIATAGCANIASSNGAKVISMDVNRNMPLGLLKYTTLDSNTYSGKYENNLSLTEWLQMLLIDKVEYPLMEDDRVAYSFDYQMQYVIEPDGNYFDSSQVCERITNNDKLWMFLIKLGLFKAVDYLYFLRRGGQFVDRHAVSCLNKKNTVIVEFNGLPGLGKTTVANELINYLNAKGYKIVTRQYRKNLFYTLHHPFPELFSPSLYRLVKSYSRIIPPKRKKRTHEHWINFYVQKYLAINNYSGADFAIIDEAIIQFWVAMAFQDRMPESEKAEAVVKKIKSMGIKFVRVDCVNDVAESAKRIKSRPSRGLVFESMQHDELVRTLKVEAANFDYLRSVFSKVYENQRVITIDTIHTSPKGNAQIIIDQIISLV